MAMLCSVPPMVRYEILRTFWLISSRRNIPLKKLRVALTSRPNGFKNEEHDEHQVDDGRADVMKDLLPGEVCSLEIFGLN